MKYIGLILVLIVLYSCDKQIPSTISGAYFGDIEYRYPGNDSVYVDSSFNLEIINLGENYVNITSSMFNLGEFSCHSAHMGQSYMLKSTVDTTFREYISRHNNGVINWNNYLPDSSIYFDFKVKKN